MKIFVFVLGIIVVFVGLFIIWIAYNDRKLFFNRLNTPTLKIDSLSDNDSDPAIISGFGIILILIGSTGIAYFKISLMLQGILLILISIIIIALSNKIVNMIAPVDEQIEDAFDIRLNKIINRRDSVRSTLKIFAIIILILGYYFL